MVLYLSRSIIRAIPPDADDADDDADADADAGPANCDDAPHVQDHTFLSEGLDLGSGALGFRVWGLGLRG